MNTLILNPMTSNTENIVRDVLYGCWCKGKRIGGATVPPFNQLVMTSLLRREGFSASFIDAQSEQIPVNEMKKVVLEYDLIVISTSTMSFKDDTNYLMSLKSVHPKLITAIYGSHPTFMPRYCLASESVDIVIQYEPEFIIKDIVKSISSNESYKNIPGIGYRDNGKIVINKPYPPIKNLDELPFPDVELLPKDVHYYNPIVKRLPYMTTTTSKGCPGKCIFCTAPFFDGKTMRFQSEHYVIEEIKYFLSKGIKEIYFRDDTFFINKKRDKSICRYIIDNNLDITWIANARVSHIDESTIKLAREAGCHTLKFGIESGSQKILDNIQKGYRLAQANQVFKWTKKYGMNTHAHVMLGNPGDSLETVEETINYVISLSPTTATFGICTPYPGTPLFDMVHEKFPEIGDGSESDLSILHTEGLFNEHYTSLTKDELRTLVRKAYRRFYVRPSFLMKSLKWQLTGIDDLKRVSIAALNLFDFIFRGKN